MKNNDYTDDEDLLPYKVPGLFLRKDSFMIMLPFQDILFLEAESNYTRIIVKDSEEIYVSTFTLGKIEKSICCPYLCRVHRSYIANLNQVSGILSNCLKINQHLIPIGRKYRKIMDCFIMV